MCVGTLCYDPQTDLFTTDARNCCRECAVALHDRLFVTETLEDEPDWVCPKCERHVKEQRQGASSRPPPANRYGAATDRAPVSQQKITKPEAWYAAIRSVLPDDQVLNGWCPSDDVLLNINAEFGGRVGITLEAAKAYVRERRRTIRRSRPDGAAPVHRASRKSLGDAHTHAYADAQLGGEDDEERKEDEMGNEDEDSPPGVSRKRFRDGPSSIPGPPPSKRLATAPPAARLDVVPVLPAPTSAETAEMQAHLLAAASRGDADGVKHLLLRAPRLTDARDSVTGQTALHVACEGGHVAVVVALLKHIAEASADVASAVCIPDAHGRTALHVAAASEMPKQASACVAALLKHSAAQQVGAADKNGITPLMLSVHAGSPTIAEQLLNAGAAVDATDACGRTATHIAASSGEEGLLVLLLKRGANPQVADKAGVTPIVCALTGAAPVESAIDMTALLIQKGVDPFCSAVMQCLFGRIGCSDLVEDDAAKAMCDASQRVRPSAEPAPPSEAHLAELARLKHDLEASAATREAAQSRASAADARVAAAEARAAAAEARMVHMQEMVAQMKNDGSAWQAALGKERQAVRQKADTIRELQSQVNSLRAKIAAFTPPQGMPLHGGQAAARANQSHAGGDAAWASVRSEVRAKLDAARHMTPQERKNLHRTLAKQLHPDKAGSITALAALFNTRMQMVNAELAPPMA